MGEGKKLLLVKSKVHGTGCYIDEDLKEGEVVWEMGIRFCLRHAFSLLCIEIGRFTSADEDFVIDTSI